MSAVAGSLSSVGFAIRTKVDEFEQRLLVAGPLWLEIDGQNFPVDGWYDFPVIVLGWWLSNVKSLLARRAVKCECPFMDGPYKFEVTVRNRQAWMLTFIKDGINDEARLIEKEADPELIISEILKSANLVISFCQEKGWESEDLSTLASEAEAVSHLALTISHKKSSEGRQR